MTARHMRIALLLSLGLCLFWAGCSDEGTSTSGHVDDTSFKAEAAFYFQLDLAGHEDLRLEGISGEVEITEVVSSDSIIIAGTRRVRSESVEDAEEHLPLLEVRVQDLSNEVFVETNQPEVSRGRSYEVDYEISIPAVMDLDIASVNGQVILVGASGDVSVALTNGQIAGEAAIGVGGTLDFKLTNGTIDLGIPKTTSAEFTAAVANGYISDSGLTFQDRQSDAHSLSGTLGGGDGTISLVVTNGSITVVGLD